MPKLFAATIALFLLLGAGYGVSQAARYIPWDCADWQAFAHDDRTTAILETLAENRGKTLYCGIDQSDTFSKAETWAAGKDRNERDDTVYWGERGSFRGFIAAQEGWLTEGESGITGQSIAHIFEFPREKKKRRRYKRVTERRVVNSGGNVLSDLGPLGAANANVTQALRNAESAFDANPPSGWTPATAAASWQAAAQTAAAAYCVAQGYQRAVSVFTNAEGWTYSGNQGSGGNFRYQARKYRVWSATCEREVRRRK